MSSFSVSKQNILKFICLGLSKLWKFHIPNGLRLLTKHRLGFSDLRSVIILMIVLMNYVFAKIISNLQTISSSSAYYIYPKGKKMQFLMLKFQFLSKMKITFDILYSLVAINLMALKTSAYSMQHLNTSYGQKCLMFLIE